MPKKILGCEIASLQGTEVIIGRLRVQLYKDLQNQLNERFGKSRAERIMINLRMRRLVIETTPGSPHFYGVRSRAEALKIEHTQAILALSMTSVA